MKRRLVVIVYPPGCPDGPEDVWEILLGDCIEPGVMVASAKTKDDANRTAVIIAMANQARALLWTTRRRAA